MLRSARFDCQIRHQRPTGLQHIITTVRPSLPWRILRVKIVTTPSPSATSYRRTSAATFDDPKARGQMVSEFLQSFIVALNGMSSTYRISQLPARAVEIAKRIAEDTYNAGSWPERFGMQITKVAIENIELSDHSRQLVNQFSSNRMNVRAYETPPSRLATWPPSENCTRYPGQWSWRRWRYAIRHEYGASHRSRGSPLNLPPRDVYGRED